MSTLLRQEEAIANMARAQNNRFDYSKTIYKHQIAFNRYIVIYC